MHNAPAATDSPCAPVCTNRYVQNGGAMNESAIMGDGRTLDACLAALGSVCLAERGDSFACMSCADSHRDELLAPCGNFSDGDSRQGWGVHFFCGIGWPGSSLQRSPITEYCVEHTPAPQTDPVPGGDGFAQYVSCNSDEARHRPTERSDQPNTQTNRTLRPLAQEHPNASAMPVRSL
jgi:hypothetical protein